MFRSVVSNKEDFTVPIEDISPKQRYTFFFYSKRDKGFYRLVSIVAEDRLESCFHIIADDRKRSQSRLLHTFRTAEVSKLHARCCWRENHSRLQSLQIMTIRSSYVAEKQIFLRFFPSS